MPLVNNSSLPVIVALGLLIVMYRPVVRRSGAHANLWVAGWAFLLLEAINDFISSPAADAHVGLHFVLATVTSEGAALAFLMAAGNGDRRLIGRGLIISLAAGPLVQALLFLAAPHTASLLLPGTTALYFLPLAFLIARITRPTRPQMLVSAVFGIFGLVTLSSSAHPYALRSGALLLILFSAAYLLFRTCRTLDRGVFLTGLGLVTWGLRDPILHVVDRVHPGLVLNRGLIHLPELLVLLGSVLALLQERLTSAERLATHDPLTNLPNRRLLNERFALALERARATRTTIACLVIDVDNFKAINDTRGHSAGDELLRALAVRLGWHISARDVLARTGGDEFTVMLAGVNNEHYLRFIAEAMMSAACVPIQIAGEPVDVRISMGIALSPDDADEIEDLIRLADDAMYRAKRCGGNVLAFAGQAAQPESTPRRPPAAQILRMNSSPRTIAAQAIGSDR